MTQSKEFPQYRWVTPKSYTSGRKAGQPSVIFIHTTEGSEGRTSAEDGAAYDARRTDGTSTHFMVDQDTTVQCVHTMDEAHAARSHGNDVGIQIEVCGKAGQSAAQWADAASAGAVEQAAQLCVAIRRKYGKNRFPLVNLTPSQLRAKQHGFAEHYDATKAWPEDGGTHTDPGPNFPWSKLFARITQLEGASSSPPKSGRKYTMVKIEGDLPELQQGDSDQPGATVWIKRVQAELNMLTGAGLTVDGDYGSKTSAAVKKMMANDVTRTTTDGTKVHLPEWRRLYGIWA